MFYCTELLWCDPGDLPQPHFDASRLAINCYLNRVFYKGISKIIEIPAILHCLYLAGDEGYRKPTCSSARSTEKYFVLFCLHRPTPNPPINFTSSKILGTWDRSALVTKKD